MFSFLKVYEFLKNNFYEIVTHFLFIIFTVIFAWYLNQLIFAFYFLIKNQAMYLKIISQYELFITIYKYNPMNSVLETLLDSASSLNSENGKTLVNLLSLNLEDLLNLLPAKYKTYGVVQYLVITWWGTDIFGKMAIKLFLISLILGKPVGDDDVSSVFTLLLEEARSYDSPYTMENHNSESKTSNFFMEDLSVPKNVNIEKYCLSKETSLPDNLKELDHLILYFQSLNKKPILKDVISENIVPENLTYWDYFYNNTMYVIEIIKNIIF